mgnify:CR=1 FL=1
MSNKKVMIEVDEDAVETLDRFIKYVYQQNIRYKQENWMEDSGDIHLPDSLMTFAKPTAKAFGLYPYNQDKKEVLV